MNPEKLCACAQSAETPTVCQSNPGPATGYKAHASQYPNKIPPSATHNHFSFFTYPSRKRKTYPHPICVNVSSNVKYVCGLYIDLRKNPKIMSTNARQNACPSCSPKLFPFAIRLAIEYGSATPTKNENPGWIVSCSEQPTHSVCDWLKLKKLQNQFPGNDFATSENRSTSAIINNMTSPRYASTATLRDAAAAAAGRTATPACSTTI